VAAWRDVAYGAVWSRHVALSDGSEVEFSFAAPSWANTSPVDPGTRRVINDRLACFAGSPRFAFVRGRTCRLTSRSTRTPRRQRFAPAAGRRPPS
jgi:hypothetical protein